MSTEPDVPAAEGGADPSENEGHLLETVIAVADPVKEYWRWARIHETTGSRFYLQAKQGKHDFETDSSHGKSTTSCFRSGHASFRFPAGSTTPTASNGNSR